MKMYRLTMMTKYSTIIELTTDSETGAKIIDDWADVIKFPNIATHEQRIVVAPHYVNHPPGTPDYYLDGEKYIRTDTIVDIHLKVVKRAEIIEDD